MKKLVKYLGIFVVAAILSLFTLVVFILYDIKLFPPDLTIENPNEPYIGKYKIGKYELNKCSFINFYNLSKGSSFNVLVLTNNKDTLRDETFKSPQFHSLRLIVRPFDERDKELTVKFTPITKNFTEPVEIEFLFFNECPQ